ncbi:MAG: hypothetical protein ACTSX8_10900, partial [Alphaproteobacteria bacterium]
SDASVTIAATATEIDITAAAAGGEVNTASNLGAGDGVFASKVATDLQFKSLKSSDASVTLTTTATEIDITTAAAGDVQRLQFSRAGNTSNNTFLRIDAIDCAVPGGGSAGSGAPLNAAATKTVSAIRFRSTGSTAADCTIELLRCSGSGGGAVSVSVLTETIPAGATEHDAALSGSIPAGDWTMVCRRTSGGTGASNRWVDCVVIFEVES